MNIDARTLAAGRALANLSQTELAELTGMAPNTISDAERDDKRSKPATVAKIIKALKRKGVVMPAPGVIHRKGLPVTVAAPPAEEDDDIF